MNYIIQRDAETAITDRLQSVLDMADAVYMAVAAFEKSYERNGRVKYPNQRNYERWHRRIERMIGNANGIEQHKSDFWQNVGRKRKKIN